MAAPDSIDPGSIEWMGPLGERQADAGRKSSAERRAEAAAKRDEGSSARDEVKTGITVRGEQRDIKKTQYDQTMKMRSDFDAMPGVKEYRVAIPMLAQGLKTAPNGEGDNALIYAYAKAMDPGSVVRESEMAMAGTAGSIIETTAAKLKKQFGIEGGGQLSPSTRANLRREMLNKVVELNRAYSFQRQRYIDDAKGFDIDPVRVVGKHDGQVFLPEIERSIGSDQRILSAIAGEFRNAMQQDAAGPSSPGSLASGGDDTKSIPIPPAMQAEYENYVAARRGKLDPQDYAAFRVGLDSKYGFGGGGAEGYRDEAKRFNEAVSKGGNLNMRLPAANAEMTGLEKLNASLFNNPVGAAVMGAGSMGGAADEVVGTAKALATGGDVDSNIASMNAMRQAAAEEYPVSTIAGQLGGAALTGYVAGGVPLIGAATETLPGTIALGTGYGAINGALESNDDRWTGAKFGGGAGALGGLAGKYALAPAAEAIGRTKPAQSVADATSRLVEKYTGAPLRRLPPPDMTPADKSMLRVNPDLAAMRANISDAADLGLPYSLADADPKLRMLAGSVARKSVNARDLAERTFDPRALDQGERAITAIERELSPTVDIAARQQEWRDTANRQARPLYEEAFQGGSTAPLGTQLSDAFNASSKAVSEARASVAEAQRNLTTATARTSRAGENVYMNANALPEERAAQAALEGAQQRLAVAEGQHGQVVEQLRRSQGDAASSAPGAIWNPRLQEFIDDPLSKAGLARGLEIQRLEALADGRPFDPTEYAVVGVDKAGTPIVGDVPNMRTLDAIKQGYDAILDDYPRDMKGNQIFDQRGRAITMTKQSLVKELDNLNPTYAQARDTYGTFASLGETLSKGYDAVPKGTYARDIASQLEGMTPAQLAEYQAGYATRLRDAVADTSDSTDPYKTIYGGTERRNKIAAVFPDGSDRFDRVYNLERDMTKTRNETLGGSPTAGRLQADEQMNGGLGEMMAEGAGQALTGGGAPGAGMLWRLGRQYLGDAMNVGVGNAAVRRADELAPVLFDINDPRSIVDILDELSKKKAAQDARDALYTKYGSLFGAVALPSVAVNP